MSMGGPIGFRARVRLLLRLVPKRRGRGGITPQLRPHRWAWHSPSLVCAQPTSCLGVQWPCVGRSC